MADDGTLTLTEQAVRYQIEAYSQHHPNEFGLAAGQDQRERIPMKKLMKLFEVKKKSTQERQDLFRHIVNEICELELNDEVGKVLVLRDDLPAKEYTNDDDNDDNDEEGEMNVADLGYGDGTPTVITPDRMSVATADSTGHYEDDATTGETVRRKGYKRRGSVTRYSIVAQDAVLDEYHKHEDVINQFRRDSLKLEHSMKQMSLLADTTMATTDGSTSRDTSGKKSSGDGSGPESTTTAGGGGGSGGAVGMVAGFFRRAGGKEKENKGGRGTDKEHKKGKTRRRFSLAF